MAVSQHGQKAIRVTFFGHVQGVGFRATTEQIARRFPVAGYVRNNPDGTVELFAQGASDVIRTFIDAIIERFQSEIRSVTESNVATRDDVESFEIRY